MKAEDMNRLERTERMMVRWMCGVRLRNRIPSEKLNGRLGIVRITESVRRGRLRWFGHLERKDNDDWVSACRSYEVPGRKGKGRSRKTWDECVRTDLRKGGLDAQCTQDRNEWKNLIVGKAVQPVHAWRGGRSSERTLDGR